MRIILDDDDFWPRCPVCDKPYKAQAYREEGNYVIRPVPDCEHVTETEATV